MNLFAEDKAQIGAFLEAYFSSRHERSNQHNQWEADLAGRLPQFTTGGKMWRGCLVCLACGMFDKQYREEAVAVGAAVELAQSALLMHDDIMDQSDLRRGEPSVHRQYEELARKQKLRRPDRFGESMSICAGDIAFFLSFDILASLRRAPDAVRLQLIQTFCSEFTEVGLAQMEDVYHELSPEEPDWKAIVEQYRYKTARYTFSMPLMLGAILGQAPDVARNDLSHLGELLGILFQIKDDGLDLFHSDTETGKSNGLDVMHNKKTLHRRALLDASSPHQQMRLRTLFGKPDLSSTELEEVRTLFHKTGALKKVEQLKSTLAQEAHTLMGRLTAAEPDKEKLAAILDHLIQ